MGDRSIQNQEPRTRDDKEDVDNGSYDYSPNRGTALVATSDVLADWSDTVGTLWCPIRLQTYVEPPSAWDFFQRQVSCSRPCLIHGAIVDESNSTEPLHLSLDDLLQLISEQAEVSANLTITVNITPDGHGDCLRKVRKRQSFNSETNRTNDTSIASTIDVEEEILMFVKPLECQMTLREFQEHLRTQSKYPTKDKTEIQNRVFDLVGKDKTVNKEGASSDSVPYLDGVVYYSHQNDCLRQQLEPLWNASSNGGTNKRIFPTNFDWAQQAFEAAEPEAINLWVGNEHAVSSMHKDPYENLFYVLSGEKVFTVCPPSDAPFLYERPFPSGSFVYHDGKWKVQAETEPCPDDPTVHQPTMVRWIAADVTQPEQDTFPLLQHCHPLRVTVRAGQLLYLPALWFHKVEQTCETVGLNYWYDMKFDSPLWCYFHLLQQLQPT